MCREYVFTRCVKKIKCRDHKFKEIKNEYNVIYQLGCTTKLSLNSAHLLITK